MWYQVRTEGLLLDPIQEVPLKQLVGGVSLENLLHRLTDNLVAAIDSASPGKVKGLMAAITAQLLVTQWDSLSSCAHAEKAAGHPFPTIQELRKPSPRSGNCLPGASTPATGPGSPRM